jgi:hypothetical protein
MRDCAVCQQPICDEFINFGDLPICHHFLKDGETEATHPAALGQCGFCGLVQMMEPIPPAKLIPRFDWITYNEPEAHLDAVVEVLQGLPGLNSASRIAGLSFNDDSTLRRFRERGFANTWRADMAADLEIQVPNAGIEMVQSRVQPPLAAKLRQKYGTPDLLIVRMILEHTGQASALLQTLRELISPSGYVLFDVPDCGRAFDLFDYTTLWEDHTNYFVESTFRGTLTNGGFELMQFECYRGPYENCLVAVAKPSASQRLTPLAEPQKALEIERAGEFASSFEHRRERVRRELEGWRKQGKVALFGAGHQSVMFINLMGLRDLLEFVVDDHPHKCGRTMPGSRLPILPSTALYSERIKFCLSSLGAASEPKVIKKHGQFVQQGGMFASIFPVNRESVFNLLAGNPPTETHKPISP